MSVSTLLLNVLPTTTPNIYVPMGSNISSPMSGTTNTQLTHFANSRQPLSPIQSQQQNSELPPSKNRKFKFTPEEDVMLRELVEKHGTNKWALIAKLLNDRTARQCRDRWNHYLCHGEKEPAWTQEEDNLLMQLYNEIGSKWTLIAKSLEHRNAVSVRNRACRLIRRLKNPKRKERRLSDETKDYEQTSSSDKEEKSSDETIHVFECSSDDNPLSSPVQRVLLPSCKTLPFPVQFDGFFPGQVNSLLSLGLVF